MAKYPLCASIGLKSSQEAVTYRRLQSIRSVFQASLRWGLCFCSLTSFNRPSAGFWPIRFVLDKQQGEPFRGGGTPGYGVQPHVAKRDRYVLALSLLGTLRLLDCYP